MNKYTLFLLVEIFKIKLPLKTSKMIKEISFVMPYIDAIFRYSYLERKLDMLKMYHSSKLTLKEFNHKYITEWYY